jgi:hypothetical protein
VVRNKDYFDDIFLSRTEQFQMDDHSIKGRMGIIDDLITQVAECYTSEHLNGSPDPNFDFNVQKHAGLANYARMAFGLPQICALQRGIMKLGIRRWQTRDTYRAILSVIVWQLAFESWYPKFLSPNGSVQYVLAAGYKIAQQRGKAPSST